MYFSDTNAAVEDRGAERRMQFLAVAKFCGKAVTYEAG